VFFYGTEGIIADSHLFDVKGLPKEVFSAKSENHFANFLRAVRSRKHTDLAADILEGHQSAALCHIANISYRLGREATPEEIQSQLSTLIAQDDVKGTFEKTLEYLKEAGVDMERNKIIFDAHLHFDPQKEAFLSNPKADALLTREYRAPFVVPTEDAD